MQRKIFFFWSLAFAFSAFAFSMRIQYKSYEYEPIIHYLSMQCVTTCYANPFLIRSCLLWWIIIKYALKSSLSEPVRSKLSFSKWSTYCIYCVFFFKIEFLQPSRAALFYIDKFYSKYRNFHSIDLTAASGILIVDWSLHVGWSLFLMEN